MKRMKFAFSQHSIEQIQRRGINKQIVETIVNNPDKIIVLDKCTKIFQKIIFEN